MRKWTSALVTGASSGIGEAFARLLARRGLDVVLVARRGEVLGRLAHELSEHGVAPEVLVADLVTAEGMAAVESRLADTGRPIDVLVNNAGFGTGGPLHAADPAEELALVEIHGRAVLRLTHAALKAQTARGKGGILNVASVTAFQPVPTAATYAACKAFTLSFTQAVHLEASGTGVHVSCLCPGGTRTEFWDSAAHREEAVPRLLWQSSQEVARTGLRGLRRNDAVIVPGLVNQALAAGVRVTPRLARHAITTAVVDRMR